MSYSIQRVQPGSIEVMHELLTVFGDAFDEPDTYGAKRPSDDYLERLLASDDFIALVALHEGRVVGGLAAYELRKFEQERSEIYIYDLAVARPQRRQGIAISLIEALKQIASERGAYVIFVQADYGDDAAIALYNRLGTQEEVLHFDIPVRQKPEPSG